ncbi:hypothetical protein GBA52_008622 [Prunus armeniaca]|nr:hypothetical protein GBA52_008622 [Prunus armeniaca]
MKILPHLRFKFNNRGPPTTTTTPNSFSVESTEASIQSLTRTWHRRQHWHRFFWFDNNNSTQFQDLNLAPWRTHLANFLESTPIHVISISLLIVDLILTILELSSSLLTKCNNSPNKNKKTTSEIWYHWVGIAILALLSAKTMAQAVGLGMRTFLLAASRVVESAFELSDEAIEAQIQSVVCQFEMLKEENRRLAETISEQDKIIEKLQEDLDQYSTR